MYIFIFNKSKRWYIIKTIVKSSDCRHYCDGKATDWMVAMAGGWCGVCGGGCGGDFIKLIG